MVFAGFYFLYTVDIPFSFFFCCRKFLPILLPLSIFTAFALEGMELKKSMATISMIVFFSLGVFADYTGKYVLGNFMGWDNHPNGPPGMNSMNPQQGHLRLQDLLQDLTRRTLRLTCWRG